MEIGREIFHFGNNVRTTNEIMRGNLPARQERKNRSETVENDRLWHFFCTCKRDRETAKPQTCQIQAYFFSFFERLQCSQNCHFLHLIARCFESSQWIFKLFRWFWYKNKRMWYPIEKMYQEASECGWSLEPRENIVWNSKVKFPLDIFLHLSSWLFSFFAKTQREVSKETKAENHSNFFSWAFGFRIHRRYYVRKAGNKSVDFFRSSERENDRWTLNLTRLSANVA